VQGIIDKMDSVQASLDKIGNVQAITDKIQTILTNKSIPAGMDIKKLVEEVLTQLAELVPDEVKTSDELVNQDSNKLLEQVKKTLDMLRPQFSPEQMQELLTGAIAAIKDMVPADAARVLEDIQQALQKNNKLSPEAIQKLVTSGKAAIKDVLPAEVAAALEAALQAMQQNNFPELIQKVREVVESFLPAISGGCLKCAVDVANYCSEQELPPTPTMPEPETTTAEIVSVFSACTGRESLLWLVLVGVMVGKP